MKRILCILKTTGFDVCSKEKLFEGLPEYKKEFLMEGIEYQQRAEDLLRKESKKYDLNVHFVKDKNCSKVKCSEYDLVLTLGGDGTFLTAAQHCMGTPIFGINSYPHPNPKRGSVGELTSASLDTISNAVKKIISGKYVMEKWPRLNASVNGEDLAGLAVNEIYFGPVEQDKICDFKLRIPGKEEVFSSSGVIICTAKGSTAWYHNAGGESFTKRAVGILVREPNKRREPSFSQSIINPKEEIFIETGGDGNFLSFDSRVEHRHFLSKEGSEIIIKLAKGRELNVVKF